MQIIEYYHRSSGEIRREEIYGEKSLRWLYSPSGRWARPLVARSPLFSRLYGWWMRRPSSRKAIAPFIEKFQINAAEFAENPETFPHFDAFFARKLKPKARPIDPHPQSVVFPADGRHLGFSNIDATTQIFAKGQHWHLKDLLASSTLADCYRGGTLLLSRLCPTDYHRFHFPLTGIASSPRKIDGPLYSVNPIALRQNIRYLTSNKREITLLETENAGQIAIIEIGATNVGSIEQTFQPHHFVTKGEEKGAFHLGGSSIITLFEKDKIALDQDLLTQSAEGRELYALMGDRLGMILQP